MMSQPEHLLPVHNRLGESPIWVPEEQALYWVDWGGYPIYRFGPATGEVRAFEVDRSVTALARRARGGWIATVQNELAFWDPHTNQFSRLVGHADPNNPHMCYNDSVVDRQGRLLVGTYNSQDPFAPDGFLYRLDPDGSLHQLDGGFATPNGMGFSPDGRTLYVTDQRRYLIYAYAYDTEAGDVSQRRLFARVPQEEGMPDGLIVDSEGYVWSAHWAGWKLTRYDPDGRIEREVRFPVQHVICCAFGGEHLDELYVTTAWYGFSEEEREKQPQAGDLFRIKMDIQGLEEPGFMG